MPSITTSVPNAKNAHATALVELQETLTPVFFEEFCALFTKSAEAADYDAAATSKLMKKELKAVAKWSDANVSALTAKCTKACPGLEKLAKDFLIANVFLTLADKYGADDTPKFSFDVPSANEIVYTLTVKAGKAVAAKPQWFDAQSYDYEANAEAADEAICNAIEEALCGMITTKDLTIKKGTKAPKSTKGKNKKKSASPSSSSSSSDSYSYSYDSYSYSDSESSSSSSSSEEKKKKKNKNKKAAEPVNKKKTAEPIAEPPKAVEAAAAPVDNDKLAKLMDKFDALPKNDPQRAKLKAKIRAMIAADASE